jgi:hypothetical protein
MQNVEFQTVTVLPIGTPTPTTLVKAAKIPLRVEVSNVGPVVIFVASTVTDLTPQPSTATYRIFPGEIHVFVAAPKQGLYAVAAATGGLASVSTSEALPTVL